MKLRFPHAFPSWEDVNLGGVQLGIGGSVPDLVALLGGILVRSFDGGATMEQLHGAIELPHDYKEGTDVVFHLHWCPVNVDAGNVKWQLEWTWANAGGIVFPAATTSSVTIATPGVATQNTATDIVTMAGTGKTISSHIVFRLFRDPADAADTYASDAQLIQVGVHYQTNSIGSRLPTTK